MSSHITLYSNTASKEVVDKQYSLTQIEALTGEFRGSMSVLHPMIQIKPTTTTTVTKLLTECNYVYIQELNRYYFVDKITCVAHDMIELELSVDVLYSWKTAILAQTVIVSRNEKEYALYLDDSLLKVYNNPNITVYHFKDGNNQETGFTTQQYILALAGS